MKVNGWILFGWEILLAIGMYVEGSEDLGKKIGSYAVKADKKIWEEDQFGNRTEFEYDKAGHLVKVWRSGMVVSRNKYDQGLLCEQINASGATIRMNYDAMGRMIGKLTPSGKNELKYDKYGRMTERKGAGEYMLQFMYTSWGEIAGYFDGNDSCTKFEYDKHGKLIRRIWPNGTLVKYGYANGRLVSKEESGRKTTYRYDDYGRMIEERIIQGNQILIIVMTYNESGLMNSISDGKTTIKFVYDRFGRKLVEDGPVGSIVNIYDDKGRLTARQVQFKSSSEKFLTEYGYDDFDRIISVKSPSGTFNYTWTKNDKIATQSIGDKLIKNEYDETGRLVSKTFGDIVLAKYEYDQLDRRIKGQYFDVKWNYSYDQYNQLTHAQNSSGDTYSYTYDPIGNRLQAVENGKSRNFTYNSLNQISSNGYFYDAWGNMTHTPEAEYSYDLKNRLVEVKKNDGCIIRYEYDPMGQRIASTVNDRSRTIFFMSDMIELARYNDLKHYHTLGLDTMQTLNRGGGVGAVLATQSGLSQVSRNVFFYDGCGNLVGQQDVILNRFSYTPNGVQTFTTGKADFSYSSKTLDDSQLVYFGYRFYSPAIARWITTDPILESGGHNLYSYVGNSFGKIDPIGLYPVCPEGAVLRGCLPSNICQYRTTTPAGGPPPATNACGSAESQWVPNGFLGIVDFSTACNIHDLCYSRCNSGQSTCDNDFLSRMANECTASWIIFVPGLYEACVGQSLTYAAAVGVMGGGPYNNAQEIACKWELCCKE